MLGIVVIGLTVLGILLFFWLVSQQGTRIDGQKRAESEGGQGCVHLKQLA